MFSQHDSPELNEFFQSKPFQGQHPSQARVIFFGRDANYPSDIDNNEKRPGCFDLLRQYHKDGVGFWQNAYGNNPRQKHHPFLIFMKHGDPGFKYHQVFSEMNLSSHYANHISFVELLNVPTMGDPKNDPDNNFRKLLQQSHDHLSELLQQMSRGEIRRAVFIPNSAIVKMNGISIVPLFYQQIFIRNETLRTNYPRLIFKYGNIDVYKCYHFSDARGRGQLTYMKEIIDDYM
jgi:hypothetical protein